MSTLGVLVVGVWMLALGIATADHEWKYPLARRIARNTVIRRVVAAMILLATGWFARDVHRPGLTDPEATENKYIRITAEVAAPDNRLAHAMLIEFGVNKLHSEGIAVAVQVDADHWEDWYGIPGRTDKQPGNELLMEYDGKYSAENPVIRLSDSNLELTPRKSYYLCIMSSRELQEPNDIMYFTVELNERTTLSARKQVLGHQYQLE